MSKTLPSMTPWWKLMKDMFPVNADILNENLVYQKLYQELSEWLTERARLPGPLTTGDIKKYISAQSEKTEQTKDNIYKALHILFPEPDVVGYMITRPNDASILLLQARDELNEIPWPGMGPFGIAYAKIIELNKKRREKS